MLAGQQIGPFSIEKEIGSGAMGAVYRARYTKTGQRVAIKIIAPGLENNETAMERFEREAAILKQLQHPNIVRLYASGKFHGTPFYAMEYVQGESLDRVMARRGRMSWEEVVAIGQQLCAALQHAHEHGIIHRDLKPSNLMVLRDGTVKLTDFGIAKDLDGTQLTSANCTVGTASYMSPEQCKGERNLTHKSDLYSLGVLLYELITGRKPFQAETPMDMFLQHVQGTFERPSRLVLDMPVWLDTLICQLLEKKPDQRPLDAATVGEALNRVQEKVLAQQSAGIDVVRPRPGEISKAVARLDQEDKEAARLLLGRRARKRKKSPGVPFYSRIWFKAAGYLVLLGGILFLVYWLFLRRPDPEQLFEQAQKLMREDAPDQWEEARDGPLQSYLQTYPNREDEQARHMHLWADLANVNHQDGLLRAWIQNQAKIESTPEELARRAIAQEKEGKTDEALENWDRLTDYKKSSNTEQRTWGLLGEQGKAELQLKLIIEGKLPLQKGIPPLALTAKHSEMFGDAWNARADWEKLRSQAEDKSGMEVWYILARLHLTNEVPKDPDPEKARLRVVQKKLDEAARLAAEKPEEALKIYRDIIILYLNNKVPEINRLAKEAQERFQKLSAKPKKKGTS